MTGGAIFLTFKLTGMSDRNLVYFAAYIHADTEVTVFSYEVLAFVLFLVTGVLVVLAAGTKKTDITTQSMTLANQTKHISALMRLMTALQESTALVIAAKVMTVISVMFSFTLFMLVVGPHPDSGAICWTVVAGKGNT